MTMTEGNKKEEKGRGRGSNKDYAARIIQLLFLLNNLPTEKRTAVSLIEIMKISPSVFYRLLHDLKSVMGVSVGYEKLVGSNRLMDIETGKASVRGYYFMDNLGIFNPDAINSIFLRYGTLDETSVEERREHIAFAQETLKVVNRYRVMYAMRKIEK